MTITADPPRGGTYEEIGGARRLLMLRMGEIERFEDKHIGIFAAWQKMLTGDLSVAETVDLLALALVGGGMSDEEAEQLMAAQPPEELFRMREASGAVMAAALLPDADFYGDDDPDEDATPEKKKKPNGWMFAKLFGRRRQRVGDRVK